MSRLLTDGLNRSDGGLYMCEWPGIEEPIPFGLCGRAKLIGAETGGGRDIGKRGLVAGKCEQGRPLTHRHWMVAETEAIS
jgi:hypothetical protein